MSQRPNRQRWLVALCCACPPVVAVAQVPAGPEALVSAIGAQPSLVARGSTFALAWADLGGISGRLFRSGATIEFGAGDTGVKRPQLGMDADGDLVLVFEGGDDRGFGVFARRFRRNGAAQGVEFRVDTAAAGREMQPRLAVAPDGSFIVGWEDDGGGAVALRLARFGADGRRRGRPMLLNARSPVSLIGGLGASTVGFVAGWTEVSRCADDTLHVTAAVATFTTDLRPRGNAARFSDGAQCAGGPVLAAVPSSRFGPLAVLDGHQVTVQRLAPANGAPVGERTVVAAPPACDAARCEHVAAVAGDERGRVVVVYEVRFTDAATGAPRYHLFAQLYGRDGRARSPYFQVTGKASTAEQHPAAALTAAGALHTAWRRSGEHPGLIYRNFRLGGALESD